MKRVLLLTGRPGAGKTGLIEQAVSATKLAAGGFYTREIRLGGARQGFRIVTLDGRQAVLAHVNITSSCRVGRYKVDVNTLDALATPALRSAVRDAELIVIDEIGKMELHSNQFCRATMEALESGKRVLGTIMLNPNPFADEVKRHPHVDTLVVTRENHTETRRRLSDWLAGDL